MSLKLLNWQPIDGAGALVGRASVEIPIGGGGLVISDCPVFAKDGSRWATLPSEMLRDSDGRPILGPNGRPKYVSRLKWSSRDLQDRFSGAVLAAVDSHVAANPLRIEAEPAGRRLPARQHRIGSADARRANRFAAPWRVSPEAV